MRENVGDYGLGSDLTGSFFFEEAGAFFFLGASSGGAVHSAMAASRSAMSSLSLGQYSSAMMYPTQEGLPQRQGWSCQHSRSKP